MEILYCGHLGGEPPCTSEHLSPALRTSSWWEQGSSVEAGVLLLGSTVSPTLGLNFALCRGFSPLKKVFYCGNKQDFPGGSDGKEAMWET